MSCNKPLVAYQAFKKNTRGTRSISFSPDGGTHPIALPCGQCIGCRLDKARAWAMRIYLEGLQHEDSCFVTLTYDEENIPDGNTLSPTDLQRFIKNLRNHHRHLRLRYYAVGEYGGITQRPHYHAILFGIRFHDRSVFKHKRDYSIDISGTLARAWPHGVSTIQDNSIEAAAYVSRYAVKKITGKKAEEAYQVVDPETGEIFQQHPEFARMSRNPGIGSEWLKKYHSDLYPKGYVTDGKGNKFPPPEYFNKLFEKWHPEVYQAMREERREEVFEKYSTHNYERAEAREKIQKAKINLTGGEL